jgi:hypothetical protein
MKFNYVFRDLNIKYYIIRKYNYIQLCTIENEYNE